jgi:hypothetical protein
MEGAYRGRGLRKFIRLFMGSENKEGWARRESPERTKKT